MNELTSFILWNGFLFAMVFTLGWASNELYDSWTNERVVDGFYVENITRIELETVKTKADYYGDFVCVNVKGMDFKYAQQVVSHEILHKVYSEIYAELCEDNFDECTDKLTEVQEEILK